MIYLDNAATSWPKPPGVAASVASCITELPGSVGRASHSYALAAGRLLFETRARLAAFLGIGASERLVFTKNATEALNIALFGALRQGGRVLCSCLEHNAVMRPLRSLEAGRGVSIEVFPVDADGLPDLDFLRKALRPSSTAPGPDLLVVTAASNVTGAILPLGAIVAEAKAQGVPVLVDGSQIVGHRAIHLDSLGADYFAFSGHKALLGPGGTGGLYLAPGRDLPPLIHGGTGSASESENMPVFLPDGQEAGTHNLPALAGLGAALAWLCERGLTSIAADEETLVSRLETGLLALPGLSLQGPGRGRDRLPLLSCLSSRLALDELARELDRRGIAARMGLHCAPAAHRSLGSLAGGGSLRFSPGPFTTSDEIDDCLAAVREILS